MQLSYKPAHKICSEANIAVVELSVSRQVPRTTANHASQQITLLLPARFT
jgi:hypothetical protein